MPRLRPHCPCRWAGHSDTSAHPLAPSTASLHTRAHPENTCAPEIYTCFFPKNTCADFPDRCADDPRTCFRGIFRTPAPKTPVRKFRTPVFSRRTPVRKSRTPVKSPCDFHHLRIHLCGSSAHLSAFPAHLCGTSAHLFFAPAGISSQDLTLPNAKSGHFGAFSREYRSDRRSPPEPALAATPPVIHHPTDHANGAKIF